MSSRSLAALAVLMLSGCLESTQYTLEVTTDVPCERLNGTTITVGLPGTVERGIPSTLTRVCTQDGKVGAIGTFAIVPGKNRDVVATAKVATAVGSDVAVETDCLPDKSYAGCIVSRRIVTFVPHRSLTIPVQLFLACKDVSCDEGSTCNRAGKCVSAKVDVAQCADGICSELTTEPGAGLPCANTASNDPLFCRGLTPWCTRDEADGRACAAAPSTTPGVASFQCLNDHDCVLDQRCVPGSTGIAGACVAFGAPKLTGVNITNASPTNATSLALTYAGQGGAMNSYCILENTADALPASG